MAKIRHYGPGDRVYVQAQRIWLILTGFVSGDLERLNHRKIRTLTYGDLALRMGYSSSQAGHTLGRQLGIVGRCCLENDLPALNSIVVNTITGLPGDHVVLTPGNTIKEEQRAVCKLDWYSVGVPSTGTLRKVWEN